VGFENLVDLTRNNIHPSVEDQFIGAPDDEEITVLREIPRIP
jgi:hypothetical protein